ncbi:diacylglycerol/lipid kinase family protein [Aerococcaceae bacterium WGS1372]
MLDKVLLIVNPVAGKAQGEKYANKLKEILEDNHQSSVEIKVTKEENDAYEWSKNAYSDGFSSVICLGGDGTVSETVSGLMQNQQRPNFGFIAMGTVNDLARSLGYHLNPEKAVNDFVNIKLDKLDIGKVNDKYFINVIAIGPIAEEVMTTDSDDKNKFGVLAYIRDGLKAFFTSKGYNIRVTDSKDNPIDIKTNLLLVGLTNSVGGVEFMIPEANYNDGEGYLIAIKGHTPLSTIAASLEVGFSNLSADNLYKLSDQRFKIESLDNVEIKTNIDGDKGPNLPIDVEIIKHAIDVIVPK